jgi:shikimate dehydrogenase
VAGAVNTVVLEGGHRVGHNTDVPGAIAALTERFNGPYSTAVVLGGGATAASLLLALSELGCEGARLLVREPARAKETLAAVERHGRDLTAEVGRLDEEFVAPDVLVSTIPAEAQAPDLVASSRTAGVVFEVRYDPWPTPLAAAAIEDVRPLVSGLDLLVHQALLQVQLMTGQVPSLSTLRAAGEQALAARASGGTS